MFIITAMINGEKYYYDGYYFTMNSELSELYFDAFDAILEMLAVTVHVHPQICNLKVEEI